MTILELLDVLGRMTWQPVWMPVLTWTALALPLWVLLERTDRLHPLAEYRLRQVLLAALPLGIAAVSVAEWLPEPAAAPSLPSPSIVVLPAVEATDTAPAAPALQWMHAVGLLTAVALAAGAIRLGRLLLEVVAAARVRRRVEDSSAPSVQAQVDRLADRLEIRRSVQSRTAPEAAVPITLGGLRPTILLPPGLLDKPDALHTTLVHECIHIRRWDDLAHVAERLVAALFAVHPFVERLCRGIAEARERACDAAVLGDDYTTPASYARLLVAFADGSSADPIGALSLSESPTSLKTRLSAMHSSISNVLSSRLALDTTLVALGLALTIGVVACSDSVAPSSSTETPTAEEASPSSTAEDGEVFMVVEDQPELVGGIKALHEDISYPERAREAGIEGRVIVQFVVDENGNVTNPTVTRGVHELLNEAAIEAVKVQTFKPGKQRGEPVKVQMSLPVTFRLDDVSNNGSDGSNDDAATSSATPKTDSGRLLFEKAGIQVVRVLMNEEGDLLLGDERVDVSNLTDAVRRRITKDAARTALLYADGAPTDRVAAEASLRALDLQKLHVRKVE